MTREERDQLDRMVAGINTSLVVDERGDVWLVDGSGRAILLPPEELPNGSE